MLTVYRVAYGIGFALLLATVTTNLVVAGSTHALVLVAVGISLCCVCVLLVGFSRIPITAFWVIIGAWEGFFVWYAWFSQASPFILHEEHNLDPIAVARETSMHFTTASAVFALLSAWFLSLPIARSIYGRRVGVRL
jgi:hypothetical protein